MKKLKLFIVIYLLFSVNVFSQTLLIRYNNITDKAEYYLVKKNQKLKKINSLSVNKGTTIQLQVNDFNNYLFNAMTTSDFKKETSDSAASFSGIISVLGILGQTHALIPALSATTLTTNTSGFAGKSNNRLLTLMPAIKELEEIDKTLTNQSEKITKTFSGIQDVYLVRMQINDVLYNPQLTSAEIKRKVKENLKSYLNSDTINLAVVMNFSKSMLNNLNNDLAEFANNLNSFNSKSSNLLASASNDPELLKETVFTEITERKDFLQKYYSSLQTEKTQISGDTYNTELLKLYKDYISVESNSFTYNYSTVGEDFGKMYLNLSVLNKDTSISDTSNIIKYKIFPVNLSGGLKIGSGVGFVFMSNFAGQEDFYLDSNRKIISSPGDNFTPSLAAMIHFYNKSYHSIKLGGNFGFALPLSSENMNLGFLLGLSAIFGKNDALVLSGGISGMKIKVLDRGLKTGDYYTDIAGTGVPTKFIYDMGGYVGISVNIAGMQK